MKKTIAIVGVLLCVVAVIALAIYSYTAEQFTSKENVSLPEELTAWVHQHTADLANTVWLEAQGYSPTVVNGETCYANSYGVATVAYDDTFLTVRVYNADRAQSNAAFEMLGKRITYYVSPVYCLLHGEEIPKIYEYYYEYEQENGMLIEIKVSLGQTVEEDHEEQIKGLITELR